MTEAEYVRKRKALFTKWGHASQNWNAWRLKWAVKLNKSTGKDAGKMRKLAKFTVALKKYNKQPSAIGFKTGELAKSLQRRSNVKVQKFGSDGEECLVMVDDAVGQRLWVFENGREWVPTKKEAWWLMMRSQELAVDDKGARINFFNRTLRQPPRPFFGPTKAVNDWLKLKLNELQERFVNEALKEAIRKKRKK